MSDDLTPVSVRLQPADRAALDDYRRAHEDPPSRARAALDLIRRGLASRDAGHAGHAA